MAAFAILSPIHELTFRGVSLPMFDALNIKVAQQVALAQLHVDIEAEALVGFWWFRW